jgi:lysyl-tRNA synthetase, class II
MEKTQVYKDRLVKLKKIRGLGLNPYVGRFDRTYTTTEALELAKKGMRTVGDIEKKPKNEVRLAGRIMTLREHGKLVFAQLQDFGGRIQICWKNGHTPDDQFEFIKLLDMGDFVGVTGELFETKHGEVTVLISDCVLLSKSLRPLPDKWHGLKDREKCYRERHLDMVTNLETRKRFEFRSKLVQKLRDFYYEHGFIEIETPVLENISSGATAKPFITHHIDVYLRIAAGELWQKTAVVGGFEKTFEVARVFRNEGMDPSHLQEFTMVEHYAAYWDYDKNMEFTEQMFEWLLKEMLGTTKVKIKDPKGKEQEVDFKAPWPREKFYDLVKKDSGLDPDDYDNADELRAAIKKRGIKIEDMDSMGFGSLVDHLYKKVSRPKLVGPVFVIEHPVEMKPLSRKNDENPGMCDTFQLLVNGWEVINAYSEIVDPRDQRERFEAQAEARSGGDEEAMMMNEEYLRTMEHGMPPMSGWGMGVDRLVTLLTQQDNLRDVVMFPLMRPAHGGSSDDSAEEPAFEKVELDTPTMDGGKHVEVGISLEDAYKLVDEHISDVAIKNHSKESGVVMRALAKHFGADEEAWHVLGLLHDIDWDLSNGDFKSHGIICEGILRDAGATEETIQIVKSHIYGVPGSPLAGETRKRLVEHALAAGETITGLIHACALVRPSKKLADVPVKSVLKKYKDKAFAKGVMRNIIAECERIGFTLDEFIELALNAMKEIAEEVGL